MAIAQSSRATSGSQARKSQSVATTSYALRGKLTVDEICEDLGISRRTFYEWRAHGTGPKCIKLPNGQLRVRRADYERWLETREAAA